MWKVREFSSSSLGQDEQSKALLALHPPHGCSEGSSWALLPQEHFNCMLEQDGVIRVG